MMHAWEAIQKTLETIESHLDQEIEIEDLAAEAALSPFYYQRLFSRLVKKPVREYIRLRRLAKASKELAESPRRILDIAMDCGFSSHETLTRAFREAYGMTPEQYRANPVMLNQFDKPDLLLRYTMVDVGVPLINDGLVLEMKWRATTEPIHFLGVTGYVPIEGQLPLGKNTGVDVPGETWARFHQAKAQLPRVPQGRELGVAYMGDAPKGCFTYFAGAEVEPGAEMEGYTAFTLPAREYLICAFEAETREELVTTALNKAVNYSGWWQQEHGLHSDAYSPEVYYGDETSTYMELWVPVNRK